MAVKSTDRNEHWALIWVTETDTYKSGKADLVLQFRKTAASPMKRAK